MATPEGSILRLVLDYLAAKKVWHRRMNSGALKAEYKGKTRFMRYGSVGMADVLAVKAWTMRIGGSEYCENTVYWLEVKAPRGRLSEAQEAFKKEVTEAGMQYIVVRSLDDLKGAGL